MLKEIRTRGDIILFIDEMHTLVGAGAAEGAIDAAPASSSRCWPAASSRPSARRPSTSTASTSRRTPRSSGGSSRSRCGSRRWPSRSRSSRACATATRRTTTVSITDAALVARRPGRPLHLRPVPADKAIDLIDEAGVPDADPPDDRAAGPARLRRADRPGAPNRVRDRRAGLERAARLRDEEERSSAQKAQRERSGRPVTSTSCPRSTTADRGGPGQLDGHPCLTSSPRRSPPAAAHRGRAAKRVISQKTRSKPCPKAIRRTPGRPSTRSVPSGSFIFAGPSGIGETGLLQGARGSSKLQSH